MISSLRGTVLAVSAHGASIEVSGIGYSVAMTPEQVRSLRVGSEARLHTALIVREDDLSLYGFADRAELDVFDLLRGVTGVGPKSALGVLAVMSPPEIARAVETEDDAAFRKVSGIGPKTAKLIVVSLAGKLGGVDGISLPPRVASGHDRTDAITALTSLGFPERRAQDAVDDAILLQPDAAVPAIVRLALAALGPAGVR